MVLQKSFTVRLTGVRIFLKEFKFSFYSVNVVSIGNKDQEIFKARVIAHYLDLNQTIVVRFELAQNNSSRNRQECMPPFAYED